MMSHNLVDSFELQNRDFHIFSSGSLLGGSINLKNALFVELLCSYQFKTNLEIQCQMDSIRLSLATVPEK